MQHQAAVWELDMVMYWQKITKLQDYPCRHLRSFWPPSVCCLVPSLSQLEQVKAGLLIYPQTIDMIYEIIVLQVHEAASIICQLFMVAQELQTDK